jgi:hypothetical protein
MKTNVTGELNVAPLEAFADCFFKNFLNDSTKCIQVGRSHFEKKRKTIFYFLLFFYFFFRTSPGTLLPDHVIIKSALKRLGKRRNKSLLITTSLFMIQTGHS